MHSYLLEYDTSFLYVRGSFLVAMMGPLSRRFSVRRFVQLLPVEARAIIRDLMFSEGYPVILSTFHSDSAKLVITTRVSARHGTPAHHGLYAC